ADSQGAVAEAVDLLQERAVGAAREARRVLIYDPERQQLGGFEFRRELRLAPPAVPPGEAACHADDLEAAVAEVVSLLRVERENAVGKRLVRGDERGDLPQAEHLGGRQAGAAGRGPRTGALAAHARRR